jgi:lipoate-protein ligase A
MSIYERIHRALVNALSRIGKGAELSPVAAVYDRREQRKGNLQTPVAVGSENRRALNPEVADRRYNNCFANPVRADVIIGGRKIAGAAQRRTRRGLLQQGSIQGIDIGNGLADQFARALSTNCRERKVDGKILTRAREIAERKYGTDGWLRKR